MASGRLMVRSYGDSYIGRRQNNEDALGKREPNDPVLRTERGCLYVVSDGMGGHAAGEIASKMAVQTVLSGYYADGRAPEESLVDVIREASRRIYVAAGDAIETEGMGCTIVACAVSTNRATIAHVGDSRAYRLRGGELSLLTEDHRRNPDNSHMLSRAVGVRPDVEVSTLQCACEPGDRFLLCTDGLSNSVPEAEISKSMKEPTPRAATSALLRLAAEHEADDNSSAIVIDVLAAQSEPLSAETDHIESPPPVADSPQEARELSGGSATEVETVSEPGWAPSLPEPAAPVDAKTSRAYCLGSWKRFFGLKGRT